MHLKWCGEMLRDGATCTLFIKSRYQISFMQPEVIDFTICTFNKLKVRKKDKTLRYFSMLELVVSLYIYTYQ